MKCLLWSSLSKEDINKHSISTVHIPMRTMWENMDGSMSINFICNLYISSTKKSSLFHQNFIALTKVLKGLLSIMFTGLRKKCPNYHVSMNSSHQSFKILGQYEINKLEVNNGHLFESLNNGKLEPTEVMLVE